MSHLNVSPWKWQDLYLATYFLDWGKVWMFMIHTTQKPPQKTSVMLRQNNFPTVRKRDSHMVIYLSKMHTELSVDIFPQTIYSWCEIFGYNTFNQYCSLCHPSTTTYSLPRPKKEVAQTWFVELNLFYFNVCLVPRVISVLKLL